MISEPMSAAAARPVSLHEIVRDSPAAHRPVARALADLATHDAPLHPGREPEASSFAATAAAFRAIDEACRPTGGLACGDDLARLLEDRSGGDFVTLARMLSTREVFGLRWRGTFWIPIFQFDLRDLSLKPVPKSVRDALGRSFDDWELAGWFTSPNLWLRGRAPVGLLDSDPLAVLEAARADRFVVEG
jgi:hypothetical protein